MNINLSSTSFESLFTSIIHVEISQLVQKLNQQNYYNPRKYLTIKEVSSITGVGTYTLRQLTYSRAMPHRLVKSRIIFDENEIKETIDSYKANGWTDPDHNWDVAKVRTEINRAC